MDRILQATDTIAHEVLITLCKDDSAVRTKTLELLDKLQADASSSPASRDSPTLEPNATKRKAADIHVCVQCKRKYAEADNSAGACFWHPGKKHRHCRDEHGHHANQYIHTGELEEGEDFYLDCYEGDPDLDMQEVYEENPERVDWSCCGQNGTELGCKQDRHRSKESQKSQKT